MNLRAAFLVRRLKLRGHTLAFDKAYPLVEFHNDSEAYRVAMQQMQRRPAFWNRFRWAR